MTPSRQSPFSAEDSPAEANRPLAQPEVLFVMITSGCNLQCLHCWSEAVSAPEANIIGYAEFCVLVDHFVSLGISGICLTGGEPLVHPDIEKMLAYAASKAALQYVCIQTNGTKFTRDRISRMWALSRKKLRLQISLDGAKPETHDAIRGRRAFAETINGLRMIQSLNLGKRVTIAFTETAATIDELPSLLELEEDLDVGQLLSGCLVAKGRSRRHRDLGLPRPEQYVALLERYDDDASFRDRYNRTGRFSAIEWYKGRSSFRDASCRCMKTPYVTAEGDLYPCTMLYQTRWRIRDVTGRPFGGVLEEISKRWRDIPCSCHQPARIPADCRDCPGVDHCSGGCPGRSVTANGVEDRCQLRRSVYSWRVKS